MERRYFLFDLDGTLTDSYPGIIKGFQYALNKLGIEPKPETYRKCIGPPISYSFNAFYGLEGEGLNEAIRLFREYYSVEGLYENAVYPDIEETLKTLAAHGKKLMVATAKPENMALRVIEHFNLTDCFCFIAGVNAELPDPSDPLVRTSKEEVISHILRTNDIHDPENAVMVGDRASDILAAKKFGLQTIGVSYGYGSEEELQAAGADFIVKEPMQIVEIAVQ